MQPRIISPILIVSPRKLVTIFFILSRLVSSCSTSPPSYPGIGTVEPTQTAIVDVFTPSPQAHEITPDQIRVNDKGELFSSERLGLCFSYPQGYKQIPYNNAVQIVPDQQGSDLIALFWLDISDSYNRSVEVIANQDMTDVAGLSVGRWKVTLGGEQALVLDGMPGQDLVRRVYIVHQQTLYILTFSPTRSENAEASVKMETLYAAVTSSWVWSPCSASE
jgi:hypothetical protein